MLGVFHQHFSDLIQRLVAWQRHYANITLMVNLGQRIVNVGGLALSLLILLATRNISVASLLFFITAIQTLNSNFGQLERCVCGGREKSGICR